MSDGIGSAQSMLRIIDAPESRSDAAQFPTLPLSAGANGSGELLEMYIAGASASGAQALMADGEYPDDVRAALKAEIRALCAQQLRQCERMAQFRRRHDEAEAALRAVGRGERVDAVAYGVHIDRKKAGEDEWDECLAEQLWKRMDALDSCMDAIEAQLDRASGRKARLLQLLMAAEGESGAITVDFGDMPMPGEPERSMDGDI